MTTAERKLRKDILHYFEVFPNSEIRTRDLCTMVLGKDIEVVRMVQRLIAAGELEYTPSLKVMRRSS